MLGGWGKAGSSSSTFRGGHYQGCGAEGGSVMLRSHGEVLTRGDNLTQRIIISLIECKPQPPLTG